MGGWGRFGQCNNVPPADKQGRRYFPENDIQ